MVNRPATDLPALDKQAYLAYYSNGGEKDYDLSGRGENDGSANHYHPPNYRPPAIVVYRQVIPFPFSDLSVAKRRPAFVAAALMGDDVILCQITSKTVADN